MQQVQVMISSYETFYETFYIVFIAASAQYTSNYQSKCFTCNFTIAIVLRIKAERGKGNQISVKTGFLYKSKEVIRHWCSHCLSTQSPSLLWKVFFLKHNQLIDILHHLTFSEIHQGWQINVCPIFGTSGAVVNSYNLNMYRIMKIACFSLPLCFVSLSHSSNLFNQISEPSAYRTKSAYC